MCVSFVAALFVGAVLLGTGIAFGAVTVAALQVQDDNYGR